MKRNLIGILISLAASLLISVPSLYAQTPTIATIPFAFTVGQAEMPAGTYTISRVSDSAIVIRDNNTAKGALSLFRPEQAGHGDVTPKLVFNRYGDKYFLSKVSPGFGQGVMRLPASKLEKELRISSTRVAPEQTVIAGKK